LQVKFPNLKRYGLEGGESMLPALDTLFNVASQGILVRSNSVFSPLIGSFQVAFSILS
jgi:hypothetical protein